MMAEVNELRTRPLFDSGEPEPIWLRYCPTNRERKPTYGTNHASLSGVTPPAIMHSESRGETW